MTIEAKSPYQRSKEIEKQSTKDSYDNRNRRLTPAEYERAKRNGTLRQGDKG